MSVVGIETIQGNPTYHVRMELKGRVVLLYSLHNIYDSWLDVRHLYARRFIQYQDETGYDRHRLLDFFPHAKQWWYRSPTDTMRIIDRGELASDEPLDDISFVFFARTLPLDVGDEYSFDRYWRDTGNPVTLKVLRRDTVSVPAGTFRTIVVQPVIQTSGLFGEGGRAEIHFSDDEHRRLVFMRADMPVVGTLTMSLDDYTPGTRVVGAPPRPGALPAPSTLTGVPGAPAATGWAPGNPSP